MPIGDYISVISKNLIAKIIYSIFGTLDLHTHLRLKQIIKFLRNYFKENNSNEIKVLEIGMGSGINMYEIYKIAKKYNKKFSYLGVEISKEAVFVAEKISKIIEKEEPKIASIKFLCIDAQEFIENYLNYTSYKFDLILLVDVIEHIPFSSNFSDKIYEILNYNGKVVISVPTPLYPKIFGRKFAKNIGHLVDGYTIEELDSYFKNIKFKRILYKYNTGLISILGTFIYYRLSFKNKYFDLLKGLLLYPFKFLDFYSNKNLSCSLFCIYEKII